MSMEAGRNFVRQASALAALLLAVGCGGVAPVDGTRSVPPSPSASFAPTMPAPSSLAPPSSVATGPRTSFNCDPEVAVMPLRYSPSMAFDPLTASVVLIGGLSGEGSTYCDMWSWTGVRWNKLHPAHLPPGRSYGHMAYDFTAKHLLLYGGCSAWNANICPIWLSDVWAWDGMDWKVLPVSPEPTFNPYSAMASAPSLGVYITTLGTQTNADGRSLVATYRWTGSGWSKAADRGPVRAFAAGFANDPALGVLIMFGGSLGEMGPGSMDTWSWDGHAWTQLHPASSPHGGQGSLAYDSARGDLVWFGDDRTPEDGTWTFDGKNWTLRASASQSPVWNQGLTLADDPVHRIVVLSGMDANTYTWDGQRWTTY
jgi:hypothetical protein